MCVCVCVAVCVCMRAHVCSIIQSTLHRNPMCSNKALCGKTENQRTEIHKEKKKTALMPENSVFKAKKTDESTS